jgi:hypothetical protein
MSLSNRKGDRGAQEVVDLLKKIFPNARKRVVGEERQDKTQGRDLEGTPGYCVQVQLAASPRPGEKLGEAVRASLRHETPVAFTRKSSNAAKAQPWLVTLRAEDFLAMLAVFAPEVPPGSLQGVEREQLEDVELFCPPEVAVDLSAGEMHYDPAGYNGDDGWPACASCGEDHSRHVREIVEEPSRVKDAFD